MRGNVVKVLARARVDACGLKTDAIMTKPILSCRLGAVCYVLWGCLHLHLWCSAAIGVLAGAGAWAAATLAAALVVAINLLLRPLVQNISRRPLASLEMPSGYVVSVVCKGAEEAHVRALMLQRAWSRRLHGWCRR
jgi:hypothetical protein